VPLYSIWWFGKAFRSNILNKMESRLLHYVSHQITLSSRWSLRLRQNILTQDFDVQWIAHLLPKKEEQNQVNVSVTAMKL